MTSPLLAVRGLSKAYPAGFLSLGRRPVLDAIDLDLEAGQVSVIAGPNGSGKSTLLRVLAGVEAASRGTIEVLGESLETPVARRNLGYLPDGAPFPPELPARRALELFGALLDMPRRERRPRADELLARVGLTDDARRPIGQFSKGMLRRFALAQAVLHRPRILLLDEPTDGLDAEGFDVFADLLQEARGDGAGVLIATHVGDLPCDDVSVLWRGVVRRRGGPELLGGLLELYHELLTEEK